MKPHNKLRACWSKRERDIVLHWPSGLRTKSDARWLSTVFNKQFTDELRLRGYNLSTIRFSIEPQKGNLRFESQQFGPKREDNQ